jgi:L-threonylcarbamoyladenylate synthase
MPKTTYNLLINKAVALLKAGQLVAFPTETVYGLGADARNLAAVRQIFLAKERPFNNPLIVHIHSITQLSAWAREIPDSAYLLAAAFWPGPLTIILKKHQAVSTLITAGQDLIALRIPNHSVALKLLAAFGDGIAAPSANRFCRISPTSVAAVKEELGTKIAYILPGGVCQVGIESTIVDLSGNQPVILRPGMITASQLASTLLQPLAKVAHNSVATLAPGRQAVHYAPETPVVLVTKQQLSQYLQLIPSHWPVGVLSCEVLPQPNTNVCWVPMPNRPAQYAQQLYKTLRALDKQKFKQIIISAPRQTEEWSGIYDRLAKAANNLTLVHHFDNLQEQP